MYKSLYYFFPFKKMSTQKPINQIEENEKKRKNDSDDLVDSQKFKKIKVELDTETNDKNNSSKNSKNFSKEMKQPKTLRKSRKELFEEEKKFIEDDDSDISSDGIDIEKTIDSSVENKDELKIMKTKKEKKDNSQKEIKEKKEKIVKEKKEKLQKIDYSFKSPMIEELLKSKDYLKDELIKMIQKGGLEKNVMSLLEKRLKAISVLERSNSSTMFTKNMYTKMIHERFSFISKDVIPLIDTKIKDYILGYYTTLVDLMKFKKSKTVKKEDIEFLKNIIEDKTSILYSLNPIIVEEKPKA